MKMLVKFEAFHTIHDVADIRALRASAGQAIGRVMKSGKVESGGMLTTIRGGYFVLDGIESAAELMELLGGEMLDNFHIESHPVASFDTLAEFFKKHPV